MIGAMCFALRQYVLCSMCYVLCTYHIYTTVLYMKRTGTNNTGSTTVLFGDWQSWITVGPDNSVGTYSNSAKRNSV